MNPTQKQFSLNRVAFRKQIPISKARGAFVVDAEWREGRLIGARLRSLRGLPCRVRCGVPWDGLWPHIGGESLGDVGNEDGCICFSTQVGAVYEWNKRGDE